MSDSPVLPRSRVCRNCGCFFEDSCRHSPPVAATPWVDSCDTELVARWPMVHPSDFCVTGWTPRKPTTST